MIDRTRAAWRFFTDPRGSLAVKVLFIASMAYLVWPVDLIPDLIPVLGWLDDLGLVGIATAYLLSAIAPYRKGGERHPAQAASNALESPRPGRERPIVTEVWSRGYPKAGTWGHHRGGVSYLVDTEGREER